MLEISNHPSPSMLCEEEMERGEGGRMCCCERECDFAVAEIDNNRLLVAENLDGTVFSALLYFFARFKL